MYSAAPTTKQHRSKQRLPEALGMETSGRDGVSTQFTLFCWAQKAYEPEGRRDPDVALGFLSMHTKAKIPQLVQITIWNLEQNFANSFMI